MKFSLGLLHNTLFSQFSGASGFGFFVLHQSTLKIQFIKDEDENSFSLLGIIKYHKVSLSLATDEKISV